MRIFWRFLAGAGFVAAALLLAVAAVVATLDVKQLSLPIRERVKAETGRELVIGGGADLAISLNPKLVLQDVSLANAPWAAAVPLLRARQVELQIALLPLLRREFDLVRLELVDPVIALETDAEGRGNWELAATAPAAGAAAQDPPRPFMLAGGDFSVRNGLLTFRDGRSGEVTRVAIDAFTLRAHDPKVAVATAFRGRVDGMAIALEGTLGPLELLAARRWPYPVSVMGSIDGRKAEVATKLKPVPSGWSFDQTTVVVDGLRATGSVQRVTGKKRARWIVDLALPAAALGPLAAGAEAGAPPVQPDRWLFREAPLPRRWLAAVDVDGTLQIDRLALAASGPAHVDGLQLRFVLEGGRLAIPSFAARFLGGTLTGSLVVDGSDPATLQLGTRIMGRELSLPEAMALAGATTGIAGGTLRLDADLASRGNSPRQWAAGLDGGLSLVATGAKTGGGKRDGNAILDQLAATLDPFLGTQKASELTCAVVRLPFANGVARIDRSIALETPQVGASARGTIDLGSETLDLSFKLRGKRGLPVDLPQLAELVHLRGNLQKPVIGVDALASATVAARVGAAIGTGGLSAIGTALLARGAAPAQGECAVALGATGESAATAGAEGASPARSPTDGVVDQAGAALGRLLRR